MIGGKYKGMMVINSKLTRWLDWAREIQALAQSGSHYSGNYYDTQRYQRLGEIAAEIIAEHSEVEYSPLANLFNAQTGYATPRVDVRAAVFQAGRLLMVRERVDGGWTMPGGWADVGDAPSEAAEREVWEEAGFRVKARKLVGVYDANRVGPLEIFHAFKLVFLCDLINGEAQPSFETSEVAFFKMDEIPVGLSGERTKPRHILDAYAAYCDPNIQAVFD
jgi:8-oxo-dGTP pyrophosphatase MutT (NUDIX family)